MVMQILITHTGGPEVLTPVDSELGQPGPDEALVRHTAIGVNFIDTYHRTGLYPLDLPSGLGIEAAGVVEAVGPGVEGVAPGDRVAYGGGPAGAYSEARVMPADVLVPLPDGIDDRVAAAVMIKGLTAQYLLRQTYVVSPGETVLIHAAAGGTGSILCQWAAALGARVIGVVGSEAKASVALANGCEHVVVTSRDDVAERVRELTDGRGVPVVYDSVGRATWEASLDSLQPRGLMVSFGNASGAVPPISPLVLSQKGSLYLTRPSLFAYASTRESLLAMAAELFDVLTTGEVTVEIHQTFALADAADAHRALEGRRTIGSTVLLP